MKYEGVEEIRILPNDKINFPTEMDFKKFITDDLVERDGVYHFLKKGMNCPLNTLVLFQYEGKIRAVGVLVDLIRKAYVDEDGVAWSGYYVFDTETLLYLDNPIDVRTLKMIYPEFGGFNQAKQIVPLSYLKEIVLLF